MEAWPHQKRGVEETLAAINAGCRKICLTSPTGGGKSRMACDLIEAWLAEGLKTILYTNRRLLVEQLSRTLTTAGIDHGVRADGYEPEHGYLVQVSSVQTERSRVWGKKSSWDFCEADRVLVDEAHLQKAATARRILQRHNDHGAAYVGLTATPLDLGDLYETLIVAGTNSELRQCGALVLCHHYAPDEPDLRHIGRFQIGEDLTEEQNVKAIMRPGVFGRVYESWQKLNPEQKPTILFGPDVAGSLFFAEQFWARGISAAHIDGEEVWVNGVVRPRTADENDPAREILEGSRNGSIKVLCNRFVLREGIDAPWLCHGIFATVFGSLQSYLQSGGRLLRNHHSLQAVTLQDHGGNWHRHGSLNADREWSLGLTSRIYAGLREDRLRGKKCRQCGHQPVYGRCGQCGCPNEPEPFVCPACQRVLIGLRCPCGFEIKPGQKSRIVIEASGELRPMKGDIYKPRRESRKPDAAQIWEKVYHRCKKRGKTFKQAFALFAKENNWAWPSPTLPLMPLHPQDSFAKVADVPPERLTPKT